MSGVAYFSWFVRCMLATGFAVACLVQGRKLGMGGALLMTGVAALDIATVLAWMLLRLAGPSAGEALYVATSALGVLFNVGSTALVVVAMILWRKPPA